MKLTFTNSLDVPSTVSTTLYVSHVPIDDSNVVPEKNTSHVELWIDAINEKDNNAKNSRAGHLKWIGAQILEVIVLMFETTGG